MASTELEKKIKELEDRIKVLEGGLLSIPQSPIYGTYPTSPKYVPAQFPTYPTTPTYIPIKWEYGSTMPNVHLQ